jgi:hypothetical protein
MYVMTPEPISMAHHSVCLYLCPLTVARQRLGENVTAATNTRAKIEKLLDVPFSMRSVSY